MDSDARSPRDRRQQTPQGRTTAVPAFVKGLQIGVGRKGAILSIAGAPGAPIPCTTRVYHGLVLSRRELVKMSGAAAVCALSGTAPGQTSPDYRLEIASTTLELSPRERIRTTAYNGQSPGPLLRFKEGQAVTIEVTNRTNRPEVVHWHGLFLPPSVDGAIEEGTPAIAPGAVARYTFTPQPRGFRWYHTHVMAMGDLTRGQYSGQHGPLLIDPRDDLGRYDQEFVISLHDWQARLSASEDGSMNLSYEVSTVNGRTLGSDEPLRVREGQRILLHVLNTSPTEPHWLAFAGHAMRVVALDAMPWRLRRKCRCCGWLRLSVSARSST